VFNASYRILWITLIFVGALSGASGIKIAQRLGSGNVVGDDRRQQLGSLLHLVFF
jgi:hypothetical protein